jgi:hypothetical protein
MQVHYRSLYASAVYVPGIERPRKVRPVHTSVEHGSAHQAPPDMSESSLQEPAPAPVFVDQSGLRGRLLRGLGWPVSLAGAMLAAAMGSSLIGVQSDAPAMGVPAQPTRSATPSPSPVPSLSPTPSPSSPTTAKAATLHPKSSSTPPRTGTTAPHGATPSGQPTKHA